MLALKHLIWDWNGTLLDDAYFSFVRTCSVLNKAGLRVPTFDYYREHFTFPVVDFLAPLGLAQASLSLTELVDEFVSLYNAGVHLHCSLHRRAPELLGKMKQAGVKQHLVSAREHEFLAFDLKFYGVEHYFRDVRGTRNASSGNGKLKQAQTLLEELGAAGSEVLWIGDTVHDWQIASALGVECVLIASGQNSLPRLNRAGASRVVNDHTELEHYLTARLPGT